MKQSSKRTDLKQERSKEYRNSLLKISKENIKDSLNEFHSSPDGISDSEADKRLQKYGLNQVSREEKIVWYIHLYRAFKSPFNFLLFFIALVSYFTHDIRSFVILAVMVLLSSLLRFFQEFKSGKAAEKLRAFITSSVSVKRTSSNKENSFFNRDDFKKIDIKFLVPGDIIFLSSGDMIPADVRILNSKDLFVSQATLTGESFPVEKEANRLRPETSDPLDLENICFMGSNVISGSGTALVLFTGKNTYLGSISQSISIHKKETDFDKGINRFSWLLIRFMLVMVPFVFLVNGFLKGDWLEAFLFAVAIAVGLTPEMLPMIVSANLAIGAVNMSKKKVIVKNLKSIQNFGAINVLCMDKTGTLTQDKVVLIRHVDVEGNDSEEVLQHAYLNSHFQTGLKNLMDVAILEHVELEHVLKISTKYRMIDEIPFDFSRRRMSVIIEESSHHHELICKGALEEMFDVCSGIKIGEKEVKLEPDLKEKIHSYANSLNETGFRVIAIGYKEMPLSQKTYTIRDEANLILLGFVAFLDPPKETAGPAIQSLEEKGIKIKILTGDNPVVTKKVCNSIGIDVDGTISGNEIATMSNEELKRKVSEYTIFAKLTPDLKERIVKALREEGNVVGFMGDGINDAPALKSADIGISVDSAVDIAKESADIILLEKNLLVLKDGVMEGRKTFGNTIKYIKMSSSSNFGNMFSMLGASILFPFLPMLPVQILVLNLLYDFSQTALPFDKVDKDYISRPRKWEIGNIEKFMLFMGPVSSVFDYVTFGILWFVYNAHTVTGQEIFHTGWFLESILSQTLIVHIIRTSAIPFFQSRASMQLLLTTGIVMAVGIYIPYSQLGSYLGFVSPPEYYFHWLFLILIAYSVTAQFIKHWFIKKYGFV